MTLIPVLKMCSLRVQGTWGSGDYRGTEAGSRPQWAEPHTSTQHIHGYGPRL